MAIRTVAAGRPSGQPRPSRRADAVVSDLLERIVSGDVLPGDLLPTESELCDTYGVSRTVVREATKSLEEKGLLTAYQGIGTRVSPQSSWSLLDTAVLAAIVRHDEKYAVLDQLIGVRAALEPEMARQAAGRATPDDVRELYGLMTQLEASAMQPARMDEVDVMLHERIMLISGNQLARAIVHTVHMEARRSTRYSGNGNNVADRELSNRQHRQIVDAIAAGDSDIAASLMAQHIKEAWDRRRPRESRRSATA